MTGEPPKNIIYIMLDDADFYDFGFTQGALPEANQDAITPNFDFLRENGTFFNQFYDASSVCTPTRISVLTGDSPIEFGANDVWPQNDTVLQGTRGVNGMPLDIPQLGLLMQAAGLTTGHFGKWHVGLSRPEYGHEAMGFEHYAYAENLPGFDPTRWDGAYNFVSETGEEIKTVDHIDAEFGARVIDFVEQQVQQEGGFYLNWWPLSPHFPWSPPASFDNSTTNFDLNTPRGRLLAMMYSFDQMVGQLIATLTAAGELDDTLIIFTSDNGGVSTVQNPAGTFNGSKGTFVEGGIRVPMVAFWPNGIPAGTTNNSVVTTADFLPTLVELMGGDPSDLEFFFQVSC